MLSTCTSCRTEFECRAHQSDPCWCMSLPNIVPVENATSCLCPACLALKVVEMQKLKNDNPGNSK